MPNFERWVALVVGLAIGLLASLVLWLFRRPVASDDRLERELRQLLAQRDQDLHLTRQEAAASSARASAAEASRVAADKFASEARTELQVVQGMASELREQLSLSNVARATACAEVESKSQLLAELRRVHDEGDRALRENHARALGELRDAFKALSSDALERAAPDFLRLATATLEKFQESAKGDLASREERIATLVKPLEENLKAYQQRLQQAESGNAMAIGRVTENLQALSQHSQTLANETQRLRLILNSNQARGRWGEETLRRVVEAAGLSPHCDFIEQVKEGEGKPDMVVKLPCDRLLLVDAKVPDLDFLNGLQAADDTVRAKALAEHAAKLRATVKQLASRKYPSHFPGALSHVVLFLPAESLFSAALEGDRELIVWAAQHDILFATPASFIALLQGVAVSWQQFDQSNNARQLVDTATELYKRVATFVGHFERLRKGLNAAAEAYDAALGSYERYVRPSGEKLITLAGRSAETELPILNPLHSSLRLPPVSEPGPTAGMPSDSEI